jgi:hypothetical protein
MVAPKSTMAIPRPKLLVFDLLESHFRRSPAGGLARTALWQPLLQPFFRLRILLFGVSEWVEV